MSPTSAKGPLPFDISITDPKARIQNYIDRYQNDPSYAGHEATLMRAIHILSATKAPQIDGQQVTATFEITVIPGLCNPMNNMHGGAMALLADMTTTMAAAPIAEPGWWEFGGVSRTLSVTYLRPSVVGTRVVVRCVVRNVGARLSFIQFEARDKETGKLLALGEHGKAALGTQVRPTTKDGKL